MDGRSFVDNNGSKEFNCLKGTEQFRQKSNNLPFCLNCSVPFWQKVQKLCEQVFTNCNLDVIMRKKIGVR